MRYRYKKIYDKYVKATPSQKAKMYKTLYNELEQMNELLTEMAKILENTQDAI